MSVIMESAFARYRHMREEFELYRHAAFQRAHEELRGVMLNDRGRKAGIDPYQLFLGSETVAYAYASEDLKRWWAENPRPTVAEYERAWLDAMEREW